MKTHDFLRFNLIFNLVLSMFLLAITVISLYMIKDLNLTNIATQAKAGTSIWVDPSYYDSEGKLYFGQNVKFGFTSRYSDPTGGTGPWIQLLCYRAGDDYQYEGQLSGSLILSDSIAGFEGGYGYGTPFILSGTAWHEGPANCTGQVFHKLKSGKNSIDATVKFYVNP